MQTRLRGEMSPLGGSSRGDGGAQAQIWNKRRSICEPINEVLASSDHGLELDLKVSPTTRLADFDHLSIYKRHHRPRPILPRSSSTPNLLDILLSDRPISLDHHPLPSPTLQKHPPSPRLPSSSIRSQQQMSNLLPRDSLNARTRCASHIDFSIATTGVIGKSMRNELSQLVSTVQDPQTRKASLISPACKRTVIDVLVLLSIFRRLIPRCNPFSISSPVISQNVLKLKNCQSTTLIISSSMLTPPFRFWDRIKSPSEDQNVPYDSLTEPKDSSALGKLAVLKVNGGLGTSMGM